MSPETTEAVRQGMITAASLVFLLTTGAALLLCCVFEVRDVRTYRRWKKNAEAKTEDVTDARAYQFHPLAHEAISEKCDSSDRGRLAGDLLLCRPATLRRGRLALAALGTALSALAFIVAARLLPLDDAAQLLVPLGAAAVGLVVSEAVALTLVTKVVPLLRGEMAMAAESVAAMLELDNSPPPSRFKRMNGRARARKRVEEAFKKAGIPVGDIQGDELGYDSDKEWEKVKDAAVTRLARAYSGDYAGSAAERSARPTLGTTKIGAAITGLAAFLASVIQVFDILVG